MSKRVCTSKQKSKIKKNINEKAENMLKTTKKTNKQKTENKQKLCLKNEKVYRFLLWHVFHLKCRNKLKNKYISFENHRNSKKNVKKNVQNA